MEQFDVKNKRYARLMSGNSRLSIDDLYKDRLRILGVKYIGYGNYEIFDYSYYDALKKTGHVANLANMVSLHNALLEVK